ncbi:Pleckstrin homology domain, Mcp5-type [Penicillium italicum]|uniref:Pleckstrin homology domain, Mcp5-type n=1 Tax=Penicillium italicum TaxID=40296 RepID=A0A0A2LFI5_PENIT|nr:Pleckstrin homology domain, Mcp5-type [Penicillium italicum]
MPFEAPDFQIMSASNDEATGSFASMEDPFVANSGRPAVPRDPNRFDTQLYNLNASSPAQAKRALEAHLAETERRLEEASRLGTALIDQQRQLSEQLKEVEQEQNEGEMGPELRRKLADLEKEYNEIGRESARAFLAPKRLAGGPEDAQLGTPSFDQKSPLSPALFASQATNSPSKVSVPSRKQRNQPSNRVHDIEFATEISTSLLAQVRQLQGLLAERDETLKFVNLEKSRLELEAEGYAQRIRALDDSEQRYKDENWALETQAHELMAAARDAAEREQRLNSTITLSNAEKTAMERELEEQKQANARLLEDQSLTQKANDAEIHLLRRNLTSGDAEKSALQKKLIEMTSQNQELAKAVAMSLREHENQGSRDVSYDNEDNEPEHITPESSPPASPNKFTPRHGHLESETLKSSLGHAHRMIQNLKSTIHREKTEKIELKRMLQDARDEVEQRRRESTVPNGTTKRQKTKTDSTRKPPRPDLLGAGRKEKSFVELQDTDWEDNAGQTSPTQTHTKASSTRGRPRSESPDGPSDVYQTATEAEDGFETANERATATESEAFQTGIESMADDSSDSADLTETEDNVQTTPRRRVPSSLVMAKARDRTSYNSTASASSDEEEYDRAFDSPSQMNIPRPRVKSKRSVRRIRPSGEAPFASTSRPSSSRESAAPSFAPVPAAQEGQSLFAELAEFDSNEDDEANSQASTPRMEPASGSRRPSDVMLDAPPKPAMVDSGVMTEAWEPAPSLSAGIVAGATGLAAGAVLPHDLAAPQETRTADRKIVEETKEIPDLPHMGIADVSSQETTPSAPKRPDLSVSYITGGTTTPMNHELPPPELPEMTISSISSQSTNPIQATVLVPEPIIKHVDVIKYVEREPEVPELTFSSITTQSTSPAHATLAVPEPIVKYVDVIKHVEREREVQELSVSSVAAQSTVPVQAIQAIVPEPEPVIKYVDVIKHVEREREIPELTFSSINNQSTAPVQATLAVPEPIVKYVDVIKHVERELEVPELTLSSITTQTTEPVKATAPKPRPPVIQYVDVIKHVEREREVPESSFSSITTQSTAPVHAIIAKAKPIIEYVDVIKHVEREREVPELTFSSINNHSTAPVQATIAKAEPVIEYVDVIKHVEREREVPELTFSSITTQTTEPVKATVPEPQPPVIQYVDVIKHVEREREVPESSFSSITTQSTVPVKATVPEPEPPVIQYVDVIKHVEREREVPESSFSSITTQSTVPVKATVPEPEPPVIQYVDVIKHVEREREVPESSFSSITTQSTVPVKATVPEPEPPVIQYVDVIKHVEREREVPESSFSSITTQSTVPVKATVPEPEPPVIQYVDVIKHVEREREVPESSFSSITTQSTVPVKATVPEPEPPVIQYVDVIKHVEREREVPESSFSSITTQSTAPVHAIIAKAKPIIEYVDVIKHVEREREVPELTFSSINNHSTAPVQATIAKAEPVIEYVDVIKHVEREREVPELTFSSITTQTTEPVKATVPEPQPPVIQYVDVIKHVEREREVPGSSFSSITSQYTTPVHAIIAKAKPIIEYVDVIKHVEREREVPESSFSSITTQSTAPVKATVPEPDPPVIQYVDVIKHVEREREVPNLTISSLDSAYTEPVIPRPRLVPTLALSFSSVRSVETHPVKSIPFAAAGVVDFSTQTEPIEPKAAGAAVIVHEDQLTDATRSRTGTAYSDQAVGAGLALNDISGNALARSARQQSSSVSMDQGSQTILSSKQIDQILMDRVSARPLSSDSQVTDNSREIAAVTTTAASPYVTPKASTRPRLSQVQSAKSTTPNSRRPPSAASQTSGASHPPLPVDHREVILAAEKRSIDVAPPSPSSVMGPPLAPASAYRMNSQRPLTPSEHAARASSSRTGSSQARMRRGSQSQMSRRSSVSSFASELEERFNMAPDAGPMPGGYGPNTDPRMIQAITQTMIGEFLWKYTRKTGSSDMSTTRHRRYFWVHPYTRTLYWSTQDPQTAGKSELRTKSVPIEAVRVVADDNPYPPGLHCRSLEVVSPGRRVRFTATTSQRHETWFNALSYLLLRETNDNCEDNNSVTLDEVNEFNPPSIRSSSRRTARMSLSSYNGRTARQASKQQRRAASAMSLRSSGTLGGRASPALSSPVPSSSLQVPDERQRSSSRLSTISSSIRGSIASLKGRHGQSPSINNESLHGQESADDLRHVVETHEHDRLENVRACCDGKHDVGSLSRTSRYSPRVNRIHSPHHH